MFTGIIEALGEVRQLEKQGTNLHLRVKAPFTSELQVDQSVAHNGVCLTVTQIWNDLNEYEVVAIDETLQKTNLESLAIGDILNLERCMKMGGRLDGHWVQGHVDCKAICIGREEKDGSHVFTFQHEKQDFTTIEKGSITLNGISLTTFNTGDCKFSVAIIPYTIEHTNLKKVEVDTEVNLEFDVLGKYVTAFLGKQKTH